MRVHLIKKATIEDFVSKNPSSRTPFEYWLLVIKMADWKNPAHIKSTFKSADLLGNGTDRVVFDIGGNNYRLICKYFFGKKMVHLFVCWLGTHEDYDKICSKEEQYAINKY
jgi:mRNA interferase HigB